MRCWVGKTPAGAPGEAKTRFYRALGSPCRGAVTTEANVNRHVAALRCPGNHQR
jgi:hypothetical protein